MPSVLCSATCAASACGRSGCRASYATTPPCSTSNRGRMFRPGGNRPGGAGSPGPRDDRGREEDRGPRALGVAERTHRVKGKDSVQPAYPPLNNTPTAARPSPDSVSHPRASRSTRPFSTATATVALVTLGFCSQSTPLAMQNNNARSGTLRPAAICSGFRAMFIQGAADHGAGSV